mgnify:CR=1 FL=1
MVLRLWVIMLIVERTVCMLCGWLSEGLAVGCGRLIRRKNQHNGRKGCCLKKNG